jgi:hypothetical protein
MTTNSETLRSSQKSTKQQPCHSLHVHDTVYDEVSEKYELVLAPLVGSSQSNEEVKHKMTTIAPRPNFVLLGVYRLSLNECFMTLLFSSTIFAICCRNARRQRTSSQNDERCTKIKQCIAFIGPPFFLLEFLYPITPTCWKTCCVHINLAPRSIANKPRVSDSRLDPATTNQTCTCLPCGRGRVQHLWLRQVFISQRPQGGAT